MMNQGGNNNINSEKKYENSPVTDVIVHAMPKSFRKIDVFNDTSHKNTGILIMLGGVFMLALFAFLAYYFIIKKDFLSLGSGGDVVVEESVLPVDKQNDNVIVATTTTQKATTTMPSVVASSTSLIDSATGTIDDFISEFNDQSSTSSEWLELSSSTSTVVIDDIASSSDIDDIVVSEKDSPKEATDKDEDGLSDLEELILGSNPEVMDTDTDGYSDFQELDKMYDPISRGSLASNKAITSYANPTYHYSLIHPVAWIYNNYDQDRSVIFKIDGLQFVQITIQENPNNKTIEDWYKEQNAIEKIDDSQIISNKKNWSGVVSKNGLNYFLTKNGSGDVYILSYSLGISNSLNYQKLFEMMVNSFDVTD